MKRKKIFFAASVLLCSIFFSQKAGAQNVTAIPSSSGTYSNPILGSDGADPSVMRADDGYFYMYTTGDRIWRSSNMTSWSYVGSMWDGSNRPTFVPGVNRIWAPDINKIGDKYVMYFALSKWGGIDSCGVGVATSNTPNGPFVPANGDGKLFRSYEIGVQNSIDPCYFEENGKKYIFWGSFRGIYAIELSDDGLSLKEGAEKVQIAGKAYEGTFIYKRGDYYYFFGSIGSCCEGASSTYTTVYARSQSLLGPYVNKAGGTLLNNSHNILIQGNDRWAGTGHNAEIIIDKNGDTWIPYHAYSKKNPDLGRMVLLDKVLWKDNWPYVINGTPSNLAKAPVF